MAAPPHVPHPGGVGGDAPSGVDGRGGVAGGTEDARSSEVRGEVRGDGPVDNAIGRGLTPHPFIIFNSVSGLISNISTQIGPLYQRVTRKA